MSSDDPQTAGSAQVELRLLAGVHAGATVSLAPGPSIPIGRSRMVDGGFPYPPVPWSPLEASGVGGWYVEETAVLGITQARSGAGAARSGSCGWKEGTGCTT